MINDGMAKSVMKGIKEISINENEEMASKAKSAAAAAISQASGRKKKSVINDQRRK